MRTRTITGLLLCLSLLAAACGSSDDEAVSAETTTTEAAVENETAAENDAETTEAEPSEETSADDAPARIVSLSPTHTEMLFAIGAGDQVVAVENLSDYPEEALELPNELSGFEPNVEAIAAYEPDLVVIGGDFTGLGEQLASIGIESWDGPAAITISDTYAQIEQLGAATGHVAEAAELVAQMQSRIEEIVASTPVPDTPLSFYHELDDMLYSIDSTTFVGEVYETFGLVNVADADTSESFGYPQLNAEFLVDQDPDLIFLADTKCCGVTAASVAERDGWAEIAAVRNGKVFEMDDDIASRWGPRIVDYYEAVAAAIQQALVAA